MAVLEIRDLARSFYGVHASHGCIAVNCRRACDDASPSIVRTC
jgi:hypothetical protein